MSNKYLSVFNVNKVVFIIFVHYIHSISNEKFLYAKNSWLQPLIQWLRI